MKTIKSNTVTVGRLDRKRQKCSIVDSIRSLIKVDKQYIQHIETEKEGYVLKTEMHPVIQAVHVAYSDHLPLVLTPDTIWYCIANAVAIYINKHDDNVKKTFANYDCDLCIEIRRDDFLYGQKNPWNEVVDDFIEKVKTNTNCSIVERLKADFSTTSKISRTTSQIVAMDTLQKYYELWCVSFCGIPEIRIAGEKADWEKIREKTNEFVNLVPRFKHWIKILNEILDEFINVFDDKINDEFWNSIYKLQGTSGGPDISGWFISFFPFLDKERENPYCWNGKTWKDLAKSKNRFDGLFTSNFNYHMNQVPFIWNSLDNKVDMLFFGGVVGVSVDETDNSLTPIFGYGVSENKLTSSK